MLNSINRRRFLQSIGSGLAIGGIGTASAQTNGDEVEIPVIVRGDEVAVSRFVPKDWWSYIKRVRRTTEQVRRNHGQKQGVVDVNIVLSDDQHVAGKRVTQINVDVNPKQFQGNVPDRANGVPIQISESKEEALTACYNTGDFYDMPGGVQTEGKVEGTSNTYEVGTSCGRVYSNNTNEYYMMTAAHLFRGSDCNSTYGDTAYQSFRDIGTVDGESIEDDFSLIKDGSSSTDFTNEVMTLNDDRVPIDGAATNYEYLMENFTTIEKTGVTSGYNGGYLQKKNVGSSLNCITLHNKGVRIAANQAEGDSGGPMYVRMNKSDPDQEAVGIVGIATIGVDPTGNTLCDGAKEYHHAKGFSSKGMSDYGLVWGK